MRTLFRVAVLVLLAGRVTAQPDITARTNSSPVPPAPDLLGRFKSIGLDERVGAAIDALGARDADVTDLQVRLAEIPAPDFRAPLRAAHLQEVLRGIGLVDVRQDATGNVLAVLPGSDRHLPAIVLSAHLDTVFPELTEIHIERQGSVLRGPGIADDAAGLAAVVAIMRALHDARVPLRRDVVVAATVGEEGEGDLRGVKHLFAADLLPGNVAAFLSLDLGSQVQIVNDGVGSRRLLVAVHGPGGHSWGDFGRPNPIHALARSLDTFLETPLPQGARSSYNVGVIAGGSGVNVIPESASLRLDLRSEALPQLEALETAFRAGLERGLARERDWSHGGKLDLDVQVIGDRPVGRTPPGGTLVQSVIAAFATQGLSVVLGSSSTDANVPMSLGVPAVALPQGVQGHEAHSRAEWCDVSGRPAVLAAELLTVVGLAELDGPIRMRRSPTD